MWKHASPFPLCGGNKFGKHSRFEEASGGVLSKISGSPFATESIPTAIAITPSRAWGYVPSSGGDGILTYTFDQSKGGLVAAAGSVATGSNPVAIAIDPFESARVCTEGRLQQYFRVCDRCLQRNA